MNNKGIMGNFGPGFISDVILKVRLSINLLKDERVSTWYKLIPVLCLVYLIVPLDFLFGPIDDAVILYLGMDWFISLCPANLVKEHTDKIKGVSAKQEPEQIVDAEFKEKN
ncbi:MAG: hypothetical protein MUO42_00325 [Anaerolineaceae bacterium]|nr:hypothetical protein [Anaerolineaceae bacterium]